MSGGPLDVTYRWIRSDNATAPTHTLHFAGTGPQRQTVTDTWTLGANYNGWEAIQILTPGSTQSNHATFTLTCRSPATATAIVAPNTYTGSCEPYTTFTFTGTIGVDSGPLDLGQQRFDALPQPIRHHPRRRCRRPSVPRRSTRE